jgi:hypothetical protein
MAYNNGFPMQYQQYLYPQYQQPQIQNTPQSQQNTGIIWVQGEAGAKSYLVAPNSTVQLWDSESQVIYLKSADASGMPSMRILDYTIRDANTQRVQLNDYVTRSELNALKNEVAEQLRKLTATKEITHDEPTV